MRLSPKYNYIKNQAGFTLIELIVVIAIMGAVLGVVLIDYGTERVSRNLRIAQNELVTNIRKAQSYTLSSRPLEDGTPVQFYILKFNSQDDVSTAENEAGFYELQAVYDYQKTDPPKLKTIERIRLPQGLVIVAGPFGGLEVSERPAGDAVKPAVCALLAFRAPFAKTLMNYDCSETNVVGDDYRELVDFVTNSNTVHPSSDSKLRIRVSDVGSGRCVAVYVHGITGKVTSTSCP